MLDLTIVYMSGNCEFVTPPPLGTSYGGGCIVEKAFLHVDEMYEKGIRLSVYYQPVRGGDAEETVINEHMIVPAENVKRIFKIENNNRTLMIRDGSGILLNPVDTELALLAADAE